MGVVMGSQGVEHEEAAFYGLETERRSITMYIHRITSLISSLYADRACPDLLNASALCAEFRTNVVRPCCALASAMYTIQGKASSTRT